VPDIIFDIAAMTLLGCVVLVIFVVRGFRWVRGHQTFVVYVVMIVLAFSLLWLFPHPAHAVRME
jgi:hypothetical protein